MAGMPNQRVVDPPVEDRGRPVASVTALGCTFDPQSNDDSAARMALSGDSFAMLLAEPFFAGDTNKPASDAFKQSGVPGAVVQPSEKRGRDRGQALLRRRQGTDAVAGTLPPRIGAARGPRRPPRAGAPYVPRAVLMGAR
jgi:hypothetical protein